ncbi:MAG: Gldg family protein [Halioglobus sp.]
MLTDSVSRRVAQKEVRLFFASPVAWLFLGCFAAITLFIFFWVESFFARNIADIRPLFEWMPILLIFLCAALTMRMWSEERRTGTLEHVMTQPVSLWRFVVGKFRACFTLLLLALICTLPLPVTVSLMADLDWGPVVAGYLAAALLGAAYLSAGLFISARTDNPIVSLIGTVSLCGTLYLLGSVTITDFFDNQIGETLRLLGSGSRFDSITRGVLDLRDLLYYLSLIAGFLALNVYVLEKERWAKAVSTARHRHWRTATMLLLVNLVLANIWLDRIDALRLDMTKGKLYSISQPTHDFLDQLQEPLLIRGYFSAKTHPLLAPLVPQLRDLIREYEVAGRGNVNIEIIDPALEPELEREANERYGISATPFQVADRYQAALVNSYFNILVSYGNEHETLSFSDLIEVRTATNGDAEVLLRNPEYDITRAIKDVLYNYRMGGDLFEGLDEPVEFIGYVSGDALLPEQLLAYKDSIKAQLELASSHAGEKFSVRFIEPEARDGIVAHQIADEWGFKPMVASLDQDQEFFFYLTLADTRQVVQLPTDDFDPAAFKLLLDAGLKRFASGFTSTVALVTPKVNQQMAQYQLGGPTFVNLERAITRDYSIRLEDLSDGGVTPEADILAVVAPHQLDEKSVFAIDQFLMRGGTVILATSPFTAEISGGQIHMRDYNSGLQQWLASHHIEIDDSLVLDKQNSAFPAPITRTSGDYEFQDVQMIDYPYFIDLRTPGLAPEHPVTGKLPQLTMAWASPITIGRDNANRITELLESSALSWRSNGMDVMPSMGPDGLSSFRPQNTSQQAETLGIVVQGRFKSFFTDSAHPLNNIDEDTPMYSGPGVTSLVQHSPESARIVLFASNDFMDDQILNAQVTAAGTQYLGPLELFLNTLDWSLQDDQLLEIRSRAHFNRTLPPMERKAQIIIEYINYALAILWLLLLAGAHGLRKRLRRRKYAKGLAL